MILKRIACLSTAVIMAAAILSGCGENVTVGDITETDIPGINETDDSNVERLYTNLPD